MNKIKKLLIVFFTLVLHSSIAKDAPASFADLAERLMPSVVNISTTTTVTTNTIHFQDFNFLQDHLLKICLKNLEHLKLENLQH